MTQQEMFDQLDTLVDHQMSYICSRIMNLGENESNYGAINAMYEEYKEFFDNKDIDLLSINSDSGDITEYVFLIE